MMNRSPIVTMIFGVSAVIFCLIQSQTAWSCATTDKHKNKNASAATAAWQKKRLESADVSSASTLLTSSESEPAAPLPQENFATTIVVFGNVTFD